MLHVTRIITVDGCYNLEKKKKKNTIPKFWSGNQRILTKHKTLIKIEHLRI